MRWDQGHDSPDIIDRRGAGGGVGGGGGGWIAFLPLLMRSRFGWLILVVLLGYTVFSRMFAGTSEPQRAADDPRADVARVGDEQGRFVGFVLDDAQSTWRQIFAQRGGTYRNAKLVLFDDATPTACGTGQAATGPFYCPNDERVYIDLGFYGELARRFGAKGDFAQAYVVAHEIGHHVQKQLGLTEKMHGLRRSEQIGAEGASVRLELQADCFAGLWARSTGQRGLLERGDVEEALGAAAAVGDDRIQKQTRGTVARETWTHGSAEQRSRWFREGFDSGDMERCDTFATSAL